MSDVASKVLRSFSMSLVANAGSALPNSFEEEFVWQLACKNSMTDAYLTAGYLGSGDVTEKAIELIRKPDVAARLRVITHAMETTLEEFSTVFKYWNVPPPDWKTEKLPSSKEAEDILRH
jgi:hypothetical protein